MAIPHPEKLQPTISHNELANESDSETSFLAFGHELVEQRALKPSSTTSIDFDGLLSPPLKLHEDLANGCGGQLWPAGMVLAKYMLRYQREGLNGKTIVELGAGGGLVGLAVALGCNDADSFQQPLLMTDQTPMLDLMRENIALNGLSSSVSAVVYDWGAPPPPQLSKQPDILLAADCVYFEPAFPLLQKTLVDVIGEDTVCYFCFKKRRRADMHFIKAIKKIFNVVEVMDDADKETYAKKNIHLLRIRKPRG